MDEIYLKALKLLAARDHTAAELAAKLRARFHADPASAIDALKRQGAINDRRFAENFIARRTTMSAARLREELTRRGVDVEIVEAAIGQTAENRPSLKDVLTATMMDRNIQAPFSSRDAARLARALARLGYPEDEIREELERFHEQ
ncbi:MAG TPA: regulatory protein RecX [Terriglobia bacterium]|nr:regulatory protein RecX [Terriglobia bacterium]